MKTVHLISFLFLAAFCNGGSQLPVSVRADEVIKQAQKFDEKTVSITGYYAVEHHGAYLCADKSTGDRSEWRIHLDFDHSRISAQSLARIPHGYVIVTGIFQYRDLTSRIAKDGSRIIPEGFGWMNVYDKQITKITRFEVISQSAR